jgi:pimeloyl-ACP methyl ester carboxylesterase
MRGARTRGRGRPMRFLRVNGCDMAYEERGTGPPVLLVHGSLADLRYWAPQMEPFGRRYRAVAPSLRHFWPARSLGAGDDFAAGRHAEDVAAFAAALGAGPVHLVGHSRGGYVAFRVARDFPGRVRCLVLAEPGGDLDASLAPVPAAAAADAPPAAPLSFGAALGRLRAGDADGALAAFVEALGGPGAWEGLPERARRAMRDNAHTLPAQLAERRPPFARADAEAVRAPTLLVGAERSPPAYARVLDALERALPDARRVTIPGAAHPMNRGNPAAFDAAVLGFLAARGA